MDTELEGTSNSGTKFLVNSISYDGIYSANYSSNSISIENVTVLSSGSFEFTLSSSDLAVAKKTSNTFYSTNSIKSLTYSTPTPSNYFDFSIDFKVYGDDDEYYLDSALITIEEISALGLNGVLNASTSTGQVTVDNLYFEQSGSATLNYTVELIVEQVTLTVSKSNLKYDSITLVNPI